MDNRLRFRHIGIKMTGEKAKTENFWFSGLSRPIDFPVSHSTFVSMLLFTAKCGLQRTGALLMLQQRSLATQTSQTIVLDYIKYSPDSASNSPPLVICHGLFGSKQNWKSLARAFTKRLATDVYTLVRPIARERDPLICSTSIYRTPTWSRICETTVTVRTVTLTPMMLWQRTWRCFWTSRASIIPWSWATAWVARW
jgi:hypothetical protein